MKTILYKFPSRERPQKFFAALSNIIELSRHPNFKIICTCDTDDPSMNNEEVLNQLALYGDRVQVFFGDSKTKVEAINADIDKSGDWDILCLHSDDMVFIKPGFDLDIIDAFENYEGLVHFPDQVQKRLITYAMMSRSYYDQDGYIYSPQFASVFCDNYQQDIAQRRGQYKLVDKQILEHRHFAWGFGEKDALLMRTEDKDTYHKDAQTYYRLIQPPV